ncbi:hypothetical protein MLD38_030269 [Melastoma candidum]|uniref:Uncharacterized protein n=1 Tax=Melastoma candidum TaxID=119954 RepID=A0ACB9MRE6_9MYRT|nr:hypothetical protein MLD38_030269 [Melastoma candidum]
MLSTDSHESWLIPSKMSPAAVSNRSSTIWANPKLGLFKRMECVVAVAAGSRNHTHTLPFSHGFGPTGDLARKAYWKKKTRHHFLQLKEGKGRLLKRLSDIFEFKSSPHFFSEGGEENEREKELRKRPPQPLSLSLPFPGVAVSFILFIKLGQEGKRRGGHVNCQWEGQTREKSKDTSTSTLICLNDCYSW